MSSNKETFVFYEYLVFFWKKKWWFLILPIIGLLIAFALSFFSEKSYVGTLSFYTGNVENEELLHPLLLEEKYKADERGLSISRGEKIISFTITSPDQTVLENELFELEEDYGKALSSGSKVIYSNKQERLEELTERKEDLEKSLVFYKEELQKNNIDLELKTEYLGTINKTEEKLFDKIDEIYIMNEEILNFEEPRKLSSVINEKGSFLISNLILGVIIGAFLGILLITLWKYIIDAKRLSHFN